MIMILDIKLLQNLSKEKYDKLLKSGMFWEYFPDATGIYFKDVKVPKKLLTKLKI